MMKGLFWCLGLFCLCSDFSFAQLVVKNSETEILVTVDDQGGMTIRSLQGVGSRIVVVDENGKLSAHSMPAPQVQAIESQLNKSVSGVQPAPALPAQERLWACQGGTADAIVILALDTQAAFIRCQALGGDLNRAPIEIAIAERPGAKIKSKKDISIENRGR
ncbi:hypothetical protein GF406_13465 [candidate division KSB1 bacterium]|nr:hypothetical protein [candidate division KSB1 bacterium]